MAVITSALNAKDCLKASQDQLHNVVLLVGSALNNLIKRSDDDAANHKPFNAVHDVKSKRI